MKSIRFYLWTSLVGAVVSVIAQVHSEDGQSATPAVVVWRRYSLDIYAILQGNRTELFGCDEENVTYLVKENQCLTNHYLFNGNLQEMN